MFLNLSYMSAMHELHPGPCLCSSISLVLGKLSHFLIVYCPMKTLDCNRKLLRSLRCTEAVLILQMISHMVKKTLLAYLM